MAPGGTNTFPKRRHGSIDLALEDLSLRDPVGMEAPQWGPGNSAGLAADFGDKSAMSVSLGKLRLA
ncbi:MAG: hypothetical protein ACI9PP_000789 [Halobacteriales archaeon]|jgi:hypothetical protein